MRSPVLGRGTVPLSHTTSIGETNILELQEELHVPALHDNLLSLTRLDRHGLKMQLGDGQCQIRKGGHSYGLGEIVGGIYIMHYPGMDKARRSGTPESDSVTPNSVQQGAPTTPAGSEGTPTQGNQGYTREPKAKGSIPEPQTEHDTRVHTPLGCHNQSSPPQEDSYTPSATGIPPPDLSTTSGPVPRGGGKGGERTQGTWGVTPAHLPTSSHT